MTLPFRPKTTLSVLALALLAFRPAWLMPSAWADTLVVPLSRLNILQSRHHHGVVTLPTVRSQQTFRFSKPEAWALGAGSVVEVHFQHSHELLPNRSWLQVHLNDKQLAHIPLTAANADGTLVKVPLPVAQLKPENTLIFRVEQHYTDKCEDPLDPSLWTQVLPDTRLVLNLQPKAPTLNLQALPAPIVEPLAPYVPSVIGVSAPTAFDADVLAATANAVAWLGQHRAEAGLSLKLASPTGQTASAGNALWVGLANQLPEAGGVARQVSAKLAAAPPDTGFVGLFPKPQQPKYAVLVVSGNSPKGVLKAAMALSASPRPDFFLGPQALVPASWEPPTASTPPPRWLATDSRTFAELGFPTQYVEKIYAPPITYNLPVVTDFPRGNARLSLDLAYSYGPGMNPRYSSLELRLNDRALANLPLLQPNGEPMVRATVPIPTDLLRPNNRLVAQFHMLPDKYGFCVDNYVDQAWGKIHDDSRLMIDGTPASRLPDVSLLSPSGYPYTENAQLKTLGILLPRQLSPVTMETFLALAARFGRQTQPAGSLQVAVAPLEGGLPGPDRHWLMLGPAEAGLHRWVQGPDGQGKLLWQPQQTTVQDLGHGALLAQAPSSGNRAVTSVSASTPAGWALLKSWLADDATFEAMQPGAVQRLVENNTTPAMVHALFIDPDVASANTSDGGLSWLNTLWRSLTSGWIPLALVAAAIAFLVFPVLVKRSGRRP
jgi:hypothetical protein